jgi:hypothetical protein
MSAIRVYSTDLKIAALICAALTEMKIAHTLSGTTINLAYGALRDRGIYGGVTLAPDQTTGNYSVRADEDYHAAINTWTGHLKQEYRAQQQIAVWQRKGYVNCGRTVDADGRIQLRVGVR